MREKKSRKKKATFPFSLLLPVLGGLGCTRVDVINAVVSSTTAVLVAGSQKLYCLVSA